MITIIVIIIIIIIIIIITIIIIIIIFHLTDAYEKKPQAHAQEAASRSITEK